MPIVLHVGVQINAVVDLAAAFADERQGHAVEEAGTAADVLGGFQAGEVARRVSTVCAAGLRAARERRGCFSVLVVGGAGCADRMESSSASCFGSIRVVEVAGMWFRFES